MFGFAEQPNFPPRFNIAPTQPVPVVIIENGARAGQRVVTGTLATLAQAARAAALHGPTIIIVGSVVTLREKLAWFGSAG